MDHFPRLALARQIISDTRGSTFAPAPGGVFLAAQRRTGKSRFLTRDLVPSLIEAGIFPIYVDLWSDDTRDASTLIKGVVDAALHAKLDFFTKAVKKSGISSFTIGAVVKVDYTRPDFMQGKTIHGAFETLIAKLKGPVALIIDEAQEALKTDEGLATMRALKSARDQLSPEIGGRPGLTLIMSGSDRDKLARLVRGAGAPFQGSEISDMPVLGADFVDAMASGMEREYPSLAPLDRRRFDDAFRTLGSRPEFLQNAIAHALRLDPWPEPRPPYIERLVLAARRARDDEALEMASQYIGLAPLQQVVLWRILEQGARFQPTDADAQAFYSQKMGRQIKAWEAQAALEGLQKHDPPIIWSARRATYAALEATMHLWFDELVAAGTWPPPGGIDATKGSPAPAKRFRRGRTKG